MSLDPKSLRYTSSHEWASLEGNLVTVGISQFAVEQLTDVTHIELPAIGKSVIAGRPFGIIESVKATFDLNAPVSGVVKEVNADLGGKKPQLDLINADPYGKGWMIRVELAAGANLDHLKTYEQYQEQLASEGH